MEDGQELLYECASIVRNRTYVDPMLREHFVQSLGVRARPIFCERRVFRIEQLADIFGGEVAFARRVLAEIGFEGGKIVATSELLPR